MSINRLISKHGEVAFINGVKTKAFIDEDRMSEYKQATNFKEYTGFRICAVLVKERIGESDEFDIQGRDYLVFESKEIRKNGKTIYSDVILFENDFEHSISVFDQRIMMKGVNLPLSNEAPKAVARARIKTVKASDYIEYSFHNGAVPTHKITLMYQDLIDADDLIVWGSKRFQVIKTTNINERNKLLVIDVIEVIE